MEKVAWFSAISSTYWVVIVAAVSAGVATAKQHDAWFPETPTTSRAGLLSQVNR